MAHHTQLPDDDRPPWFPTLDGPRFSIRAPEPIEDWLAAIQRDYADPRGAAYFRNYLTALDCFAEQHEATLAAQDWTRFSSHSLVSWMHTILQVQHARALFLPKPYRHEIPGAEQLTLCMLALLPECQQSVKPACAVLSHIVAAPYVQREVVRRAAKCVGFPAALLVLVHKLEADASTEPAWQSSYSMSDAVLTAALNRLCKTTRRSAQRRAGKVLHEGRTPEPELRENLPGEIWQTIIKRWGEREPLDLLARALDRKLEIVPRAVADQIMKHLAEVCPIATTKEDRLPDEGGGEPVGWCHAMEEHHLAAFLRTYPEHKDGIELWLSRKPLAELAKERGITVQTIINRKNRAQRQLEVWAAGHSPH
jgi:hypothetical protein